MAFSLVYWSANPSPAGASCPWSRDSSWSPLFRHDFPGDECEGRRAGVKGSAWDEVMCSRAWWCWSVRLKGLTARFL